MPTQSPVSWPWWWLKAGPLAGAEKAKGCTHPPESFPKRPMLPLELRGFFWLYGFSYINWPDPASLNYLCICFYYFWSFLITLLTEKIIKRIKREFSFLIKRGDKICSLNSSFVGASPGHQRKKQTPQYQHHTMYSHQNCNQSQK